VLVRVIVGIVVVRRHVGGNYGIRSVLSTAMPLLLKISMEIVEPQVEVAAQGVIVVIAWQPEVCNRISCSAS
jgi:hypothetical protein